MKKLALLAVLAGGLAFGQTKKISRIRRTLVGI